MDRRNALRLLAGTSLGALLPTGLHAADGERPNILFIMTDDHVTKALSCYGSRLMETPNLDRIADEGMRFDNCYVTNSLCAPSRATILTGKYGHKNGVTENIFGSKEPFDGSQQTVPKLMQSAGYQTALVGKWHLQSTPTGFDYWIRLPGQGRYNNPEFIEKGGNRFSVDGYVTDIINDYTIDTIEDFRQNSDPFIVFSHHKAPHRGWVPPARYSDLFSDRDLPEPETLYDDYSSRAHPADHADMKISEMPDFSAQEADTDRERKQIKYQKYAKHYLATIKAFDDNVGELLDHLDQTGLAENTVVIYTSDNGMFVGDHGWFDKRFMYEESLHIPLLVRYPKEIPAGTVSDQHVLNLDFPETFLDYAGASIPSDMQGRSIRPILRGKKNINWRDSIYYHYYEYPGPHTVLPHYGVRTDRYKLMYFYPSDGHDFSGAWELFDLEKDPFEVNNVYGESAYQDIQKELKQELARLRREYDDNTGTDFETVTAVGDKENVPRQVDLGQNYPNPFNPRTQIHFTLPSRQHVSLEVYDSAGRKVATLADRVMPSGTHMVPFDGRGMSSGVYVYTLQTDRGKKITKKMMLMK